MSALIRQPITARCRLSGSECVAASTRGAATEQRARSRRRLVVCDQTLALVLIGKRSIVTRRARRFSSPVISRLLPLSRRRRDSTELPPARRRTAPRPRSYTPAGISEHMSPPRLAFHTAQGHLLPAPAVFKGSVDARGIYYHISNPSGGATPGRAFH